MILNDAWIRKQAAAGMITPFEPSLIRKVENRKMLSYGCSSYGYDLRLAPTEFYVFRHIPGAIVDPKAFNPAHLAPAALHHDPIRGDYFIIPSHSYALGVTVERLHVPSNVTVIFLGKSTYARCGLILNTTPGEASWRGHLTLEISNSAGSDCRVYANEGISQALFFNGDPCDTSYEDRAGKYQDQPAQVVTARV